jgi:hypothetical protein
MSSTASPPAADLGSIDRRITALRRRMRTTARLAPAYWVEINKLLELRLWLMRGARPNRIVFR